MFANKKFEKIIPRVKFELLLPLKARKIGQMRRKKKQQIVSRTVDSFTVILILAAMPTLSGILVFSFPSCVYLTTF